MNYLQEINFLSNETGKEHSILLKNRHLFSSQCRTRSDWAFRTSAESKASQSVFWCTLTYDNEHLVNNYELAVKNNAGNINKYIPPQFKKEYDKYMQLSEKERLQYEHDNKFDGRFVNQRFKYFCAARQWLPLKDQKVHHTSQSLFPLPILDKYYYYSSEDFEENFSECYYTRTGVKLNGFDKFQDGFQYTEEQFYRLYEELKYQFVKYYNTYEYNDSDDGLLCKSHISNFIRRYQVKFQRRFGGKFRFMYNGEYGGAHHRPHYHLLIFIPEVIGDEFITLDKYTLYQFFVNMINDWQYGRVKEIKCIDHITGFNIDRIIDYVGKHFVKWDKGNYWQQKMAPIFRQTSCYDGGIGYQLHEPWSSAFDKENYDITKSYGGERSAECVINNYVHITPRFYRRRMFPDFRFSDERIEEFTSSLITDNYGKILCKRGIIQKDLFKNILHFENFCLSLGISNVVELIEQIDNKNLQEDEDKRQKAKENYIWNKNRYREAKHKIKIADLID